MLWKLLGTAAAIGGIGYGILAYVSADPIDDADITSEHQAVSMQQPIQHHVDQNLAENDHEPPQTPKQPISTGAGDAGSAAPKLKVVNLDDLKAQFRDLSDDEVKVEISDLEASLQERDLIARANNNELSRAEMQDLSDTLQNLDALRLVKLERKLAEITARIRNKPVIRADDLP